MSYTLATAGTVGVLFAGIYALVGPSWTWEHAYEVLLKLVEPFSNSMFSLLFDNNTSFMN
jgi:hypothetical protein